MIVSPDISRCANLTEQPRTKFSRVVPLSILQLMLTLCTLGLPAAAPQQQKLEPQIEVILSLPKDVFGSGEPLPVKVEVFNVGREPLVLANSISMISGGASYIDFELTGKNGAVSPKTQLVADIFPAQTNANPAIAYLSHWVLLGPGSSISSKILIDASVLKFLGVPGTYRLKGYYSSNGLSYPPAYRDLGLTDEDVAALPASAWHGKVTTNELSFKIVPQKSSVTSSGQ